MAAGAAGSDGHLGKRADLLIRKREFGNGDPAARTNPALNHPLHRFRLLVDFLQHEVRKVVLRIGLDLAHASISPRRRSRDCNHPAWPEMMAGAARADRPCAFTGRIERKKCRTTSNTCRPRLGRSDGREKRPQSTFKIRSGCAGPKP